MFALNWCYVLSDSANFCTLYLTPFLKTSKSMCRINETVHSRTENHNFTAFYPEDGDSRLIQNVGMYVINYMLSCHWEKIKSNIILCGWSQLQPIKPMIVFYKCLLVLQWEEQKNITKTVLKYWNNLFWIGKRLKHTII